MAKVTIAIPAKKRTGRLGGVLKDFFIFDGPSSWITGLFLKTGPQRHRVHRERIELKQITFVVFVPLFPIHFFSAFSVPLRPILFFVFRRDDAVNTAARSEFARYLHPPRSARRHKVIQDAIDHVFVKDADVAVGLKVKLQTLQLDAEFVGDVFDFDCAEVRLGGFRADGSEFRRDVFDNIIAPRMRIVECFNISHSAIQVTKIAGKDKDV